MNKDTNIIIGTGPVGLSAAIMRAATAESVILIDKADAHVAATDNRSLAISYGSIQILHRLGLRLTHMAHAPIQHIHISEQNAWGHTQLYHNDLDVPMLGAVVRYSDLVSQLTQLAKEKSNIQFIRPATVDELFETEHECNVLLNNQQRLSSKLVIHAEGGLFQDHNQHHTIQQDYQQTALICNVTLAHAKPAWAWERFTAEGPCALLPVSNDGLVFNLIWCMNHTRAMALYDLSDDNFLVLLNQAIRHLTGSINTASPRAAFQLGLKHLPALYSKCRVAIGNAAQTLHPVAGQGFNLGLRDAFILNQSINRQALTAQAIASFIHQQQLDRAVTVRITDALARGFFSDFGMGYLRNTGFGLINALPILKSKIAHQFMFGVR